RIHVTQKNGEQQAGQDQPFPLEQDAADLGQRQSVLGRTRAKRTFCLYCDRRYLVRGIHHLRRLSGVPSALRRARPGSSTTAARIAPACQARSRNVRTASRCWLSSVSILPQQPWQPQETSCTTKEADHNELFRSRIGDFSGIRLSVTRSLEPVQRSFQDVRFSNSPVLSTMKYS